MEGRSSAGHSQYQYQWQRLVRRNTLADPTPPAPSSLGGSPQLPAQVDLFPNLLPQQSSYHQAQLAQYNRLISSSTSRPPIPRLQSSPLPPVLSAQHIQAVPGSRPGGNTAKTIKSTSRGGHGNKESRKPSKGERALMTEKEDTAAMTTKKLDLAGQLPPRPLPMHQNSSLSHQSSSVPSTPHQHARKFSFESREPSPNAANNHSPRSAYSESNIVLPARPPPVPRGGCRYETAMAHTKRRMAYSLGADKLDELNSADIKSKLSEDEERTLSTDMRELYDRLLPTTQSESRREKLVQKLEKLFNEAWPGHDIRVHVFGSSGNLLCTDESDVDICITTEWKELEGVCIIADLLARSGMEQVICVSTAKVPIVKIWDPELQLACDMNVNNTLALENTRMIKTYVQIDPRVRQLAMIVKHWTKRRILNDAAFGGTLSSYTWICMIINFLQTRYPPVLPALHQRPHMKLPAHNGVQSSFADDLKALQDFGCKNTETLGELLFHFFRFYGHEFDYDNMVVSVRQGRLISKVEKKWHITNNNRLCVEEPFNISRNLGNTADDTSFRGLHLELRRAFDLISEVKLQECCEQYQYPKVEERVWEKPVPKPKPVIRSASQSGRGGRGGHRGGRHNNQQGRSSNSSRRASSVNYDNPVAHASGGPPPPNMTVQEAWLQRQAQAQLHNDLFATYSVLQAQENSLRLQLYNQSQQYMQAQNQAYAQTQSQGHSGGSGNQQHVDRNRTHSFDQPPLSAPLRPDMYFYPLQYPGTPRYGYQTPSTNPSSPSLSNAVPELRRSVHRSTVTNGSSHPAMSNSALRSHSQPAARSGPSQQTMQTATMINPGLGIYQPFRQASGPPIPNFIADENIDLGPDSSIMTSASLPPEDSTPPKEYVGYYVNDSMQSPMRRQSLMPMAIPSFGDLGQSRRRLSTDQLPQSILDRLKRPSRSPSPLGHDRSCSIGTHPPSVSNTTRQSVSSSNLRALNTQAPPVVNGSTPAAPISIPLWQASMREGSTSGDRSSEAESASIDSLSQISPAESEPSTEQEISGQSTPRENRFESRIDPPLVVNGSSPAKEQRTRETSVSDADPSIGVGLQNSLGHSEMTNGVPRLSPNTRNRLSRQMQNGTMSPLDIGLTQSEMIREDLPHLSPVYETRSPSPTANRKFELATDRTKENVSIPTRMRGLNGSPSKTTISKSDLAVTTPAPKESASVNPTKSNLIPSKANGHVRGSKSEGGGINGWQKISKGKKKSQVSEGKSSTNGQPFSEQLPSNNSERRGG